MPRFSWKGEDLGELGEFDFAEMEAIKKLTKMLPREFAENAEQGDPLCVRAMIYIMLRRNGRMVRFEEVKGKPSEFEQHLSVEEKQEQADAEAEVIEPVTRRILERLGVDCDNELVHEVVREELLRAKDEDDDEVGKALSVEAAAPTLTSTPMTSSTDTAPDSGISSDSTTSTSNEHHGRSLSITPAP
jgi:hypothetical protein